MTNRTPPEMHFSDLFVNRADELRRLQVWAEAVNAARLLRIAAPPGYGKTWLLRKFFEVISQNANLLPVWFEAPELTSLPQQRAWLEDQIKYTWAICRNQVLPGFDPDVELPNMVHLWLSEIQQKCQRRFLLVIDSLDELSEAAREDLEHKVLRVFAEHPNTYILLSLRDERTLIAKALREIVGRPTFELPDFTPFEAQAQLQAQRRIWANLPPQATLAALVPGYQWQIPRVNAWLTQCAATNHAANRALLAAADVRESWRYLMGGRWEQPGPLRDKLERALLVVAQLSPGWTRRDFEQAINLSFSQTSELIGELMHDGVVLISRETPYRHVLIPGLQQLVQTYFQLNA